MIWVGLPSNAVRSSTPRSWKRGQASDQLLEQARQIKGRQHGRRWPGEEHQIGDHLVDPPRLRVDGRQIAPPLRVRFLPQQQLGPAADDGQRIIDLVPRAGGELGQRGQLLVFQLALESLGVADRGS